MREGLDLLTGEVTVGFVLSLVSGSLSPILCSGKDETPAKKVKVSIDWEKNGDMELNPNANVYVQQNYKD